jgi:predicted nucleic acid-binding protein
LTFVVDNSVAIAWCFEGEQSVAVMALLDRVVEGGANAPQLWPLEALNVLMTAERRGKIGRTARQTLLRFLQALPITIDDETASRVWTVTAALAEHHALTAYDASYLELAQRLNQPLATTDKALRHAAIASGIPLLPPA